MDGYHEAASYCVWFDNAGAAVYTYIPFVYIHIAYHHHHYRDLDSCSILHLVMRCNLSVAPAFIKHAYILALYI